MLPMANEIIMALKEATYPGSVSGVLKELGDDSLLLTTARSTQKDYFPLLLFRAIWISLTDVKWSFPGATALKVYIFICLYIFL